MKKKTAKRNLCPLCGGEKKPGFVTFTADLLSGVVVVRDVPAMVCSQCGEEWISDDVAIELDGLVQEAKKRHLQVEVLSLGKLKKAVA
jgi:YgiT-type zinc finger domain-containing protein